jgi:hypothetical protein
MVIVIVGATPWSTSQLWGDPVVLDKKARSGWVTLSAILVTIVGAYNIVWALGALNKKQLFHESSMIYSSLSLWGWTFLIVGALQIVTAVLLFMRNPFGAWLGGIGAGTSAFIAFFTLAATPAWSLAIIAFDALILWTIFAHYDEFFE